MQISEIVNRLRLKVMANEGIHLSSEEANALFVLIRAQAQALIAAGVAGDLTVEIAEEKW